MAIDIASPGGSESDLKVALANLVGHAVLETGSISSPIQKLDIELPGSWLFYTISLVYLSIDTTDTPTALLSSDGGMTFHNSADNYQHLFSKWYHEVNPTANEIVSGGYNDVVADLVDGASFEENYKTAVMILDIFPGASGVNAMIRSHATWVAKDNSGDDSWRESDGFIVLAAETGRQNMIRLQPYGNGDVPPTANEHFVAGEWRLLGHS